jgi:allantoinase
MSAWVLASTRVVTPTGTRPHTIHIAGGRIAKVSDHGDRPEGAPVTDVGAHTVMPGIVDSHVHINEPGRTEWEGFATATRAAAAGGVTTLVDMPLNSLPPTTTRAGLEAKRRSAEGKLHVDVGFTGGFVRGNVHELAALKAEGVLSFKCFLCDSGVEEFPHVEADELAKAFPVLADLGVPLFVHAELPGPLAAVEATFGKATASEVRKHASWLASRPRAAEDEAVALLYRLCKDTGARTHVVHLSSSDALPVLRAAKDERVPLSAETCPHYLHFDAEHIPDGATQHKCAPPIREAANREALWQGLAGGLIDLVVSDHSPCTPELKRLEEGDFRAAWGGIASVGFGLPIVWTQARERGISLEQVTRWMCEAPAALVGLTGRKGVIAAGADADVVVFDPDAEWQLDPSLAFHRHKTSPYLGSKFHGRVLTTYVRGERVYEGGNFVSPPRGKMLP